jgi:polysaccharide export outer membrane protein
VYKISIFTAISILILLNISPVHSQFERNRLSGAKEFSLDTLATKMGTEIGKEATGILEKEIEPDKYIVGPGDEFRVSIILEEPLELKLEISPEGKMLIPSAGMVDLKGLTLEDASREIIKQIKKFYRTDEIYILLSDVRKFKVAISGEVSKPITVTASAADRVSEIIDKTGVLNFESTERNIYLYRDDEIIPVDLLRYYLLNDEDANPFVLGGDLIIIKPRSEEDLIIIDGEVHSPGEYEFKDGDSLSTVLRFAMGFKKSAFLDSVEYIRTIITPTGAQLDIRYLDLNKWADIENVKEFENDIELKSGDRIYVRESPEYSPGHYAIILGEVKFPGFYPIVENSDKIHDLIRRAGGFTEYASLERAEFIRQKDIEEEDPEIERLKKTPQSEMSESELQYFQARIREKPGVMAINFKKLLVDPASEDNIYLVHEDSIYVPAKTNFINVQGRVNNPGMVSYKPELTYLDYIDLAGGYSYRADEDETLINKPKGGQYLATDMDYIIEPGDVILVPSEKDVSAADIFRDVLTIATQLFTIAGIAITIVNVSK